MTTEERYLERFYHERDKAQCALESVGYKLIGLELPRDYRGRFCIGKAHGEDWTGLRQTFWFYPEGAGEGEQ